MKALLEMLCAVFIACMVLLLLNAIAKAADLRQPCAAQPMDKTTWWTYRLIDGRACWYRGKRTIAKDSLYWEPTKSSLAKAPSVGQPGSVLNTPTDVSVAEPTFKQRWDNMLNDVAATLWLSPTPATQWSIGERQ